MNMEARIARLRALLAEKVVDAVLVTKEENVHYFSGFRGDSTALLVTPEQLILVTDSRYTEQAAAEAPAYEIVEQRDGLYKKIAEVAMDCGIIALGFEGGVLSYDSYTKMQGLLGEISFDTSLNLDPLRQVKDADEIALIRRACKIADEGFAHILSYIQPGMTEMEVAAELEHHALAAIRPNVTGVEVDRVARDSLAEHNLNQYFGHGLGHSLGLEIHEEPRLSKAGETLLQPNMLITDEPGVYIPGWGGIRIEDTVLITTDGAEPLTHAPKEFIEICI